VKTFVAITTLGLVVAFSAPAFAGMKAPATQASCEKSHMMWDATTKKCMKGKM
jgi:hypothetical protein